MDAVKTHLHGGADEPLSDESVEPSLDELMHELARPPAESRISFVSARGSSPQVGEVLAGRYRLTGLLGGGGMGVVYAAQNLGTGREVAVKVLRNEAAHDQSWNERVQRFVREATAAGRVKHPNVVDVYDVDVHQETPFLVMERLVGESLRQRLRRGPLPTKVAIEIMRGAMRGVAEVHRKAIVHRDLKPDNIFLAQVTAPDGTQHLVPKVLDFGVSRVLSTGEDQVKLTTLTRTGTMVGTPAYMALEQLRGESVDARSDVFALGVILYEALSGRRPYASINGHDLVARMLTEPPAPLRRQAPHLSERCEAVVMRALASDRRSRYASVEAFEQALLDLERKDSWWTRGLRVGALLGAAAICASAWLLLKQETTDSISPAPPPPHTRVLPVQEPAKQVEAMLVPPQQDGANVNDSAPQPITARTLEALSDERAAQPPSDNETLPSRTSRRLGSPSARGSQRRSRVEDVPPAAAAAAAPDPATLLLPGDF